jgi:hypothetical protein
LDAGKRLALAQARVYDAEGNCAGLLAIRIMHFAFGVE